MRRKAIVTGASRGIGRGIARCLAENGYDLVFSYNAREDEAERTAEALRESGANVWYFQADLGEPGAGKLFFDRAVSSLEGLDLLVNNAGVTTFQSILELTPEDTLHMIHLDFLNYLMMSHYAAVYMKEHHVRGSIIQITSSRADRAYPEDAVYGGIKAALNRASQSMALDLAPYGIRVNCVAPGAVRIRTQEEIRRDHLEYFEGFWEELGGGIPLGRNGSPEDIGNAVVFLADEKASYITGEVLRVDGGLILPGMPEKVIPGKTDWGGTVNRISQSDTKE